MPQQPDEHRYNAAPTEEGLKRWPCQGLYWVDCGPEEGDHGVPCTCSPDCPEKCHGHCGCAGCYSAHELHL